jgi:hypothetical protein
MDSVKTDEELSLTLLVPLVYLISFTTQAQKHRPAGYAKHHQTIGRFMKIQG